MNTTQLFRRLRDEFVTWAELTHAKDFDAFVTVYNDAIQISVKVRKPVDDDFKVNKENAQGTLYS